MAISVDEIKKLREKTSAGMMDCKKALQECDGDFEKAVDWLRQKGLSVAAKRGDREATEGQVYSYIHAGGKLGVLVEVNCETDFSAKTDDFTDFCKDLAMHIAAAAPLCINEDDLDPALIEREREIYKQQALDQGKPEKIVDKIIEGKLKKFASESCLVNQPFVKDTDLTIGDLLNELRAKTGENVQIGRFARFVLGEKA